MRKYKLEYKGMGESGYFDFYRVEDIVVIVEAALDFINIDTEIHAVTPDEENRLVVIERIGRYIEARDKLLLLLKAVEEI